MERAGATGTLLTADFGGVLWLCWPPEGRAYPPSKSVRAGTHLAPVRRSTHAWLQRRLRRSLSRSVCAVAVDQESTYAVVVLSGDEQKCQHLLARKTWVPASAGASGSEWLCVIADAAPNSGLSHHSRSSPWRRRSRKGPNAGARHFHRHGEDRRRCVPHAATALFLGGLRLHTQPVSRGAVDDLGRPVLAWSWRFRHLSMRLAASTTPMSKCAPRLRDILAHNYGSRSL